MRTTSELLSDWLVGALLVPVGILAFIIYALVGLVLVGIPMALIGMIITLILNPTAFL